jgi:hypothetical protein
MLCSEKINQIKHLQAHLQAHSRKKSFQMKDLSGRLKVVHEHLTAHQPQLLRA